MRLGCVWPFLFPCLVVLISTNVHQLACATSLRKLRRSVISRKLSVDRYSRTRERRRCAVGPAELSRRNAMRRRWGNMRCSPGSPRSVRAFRAIELRLSGTLRSLGSPAVATLQRTPIRRARAQRPRSPTGTAASTEADPLFGPPTRKAEKPRRAMRPPTSFASAIHASVESHRAWSASSSVYRVLKPSISATWRMSCCRQSRYPGGVRDQRFRMWPTPVLLLIALQFHSSRKL